MKSKFLLLHYQVILVIVLAFIVLGWVAKPASKPPSAKPNILFIFADDQRYNTIHALGNKQVITPNLDRLVNNGTTFTHVYNMGAWQGAVCVSSRAMLLTGLSVWDAQRQAKDYTRLIQANGFWPQQMKQAGYETYMTGKWHVATDVNQLFDHVAHERPGMPNQTPQGYNRPLSKQDTAWAPWKEVYGGFWQGGKHWSEVVADDAVDFLDEASKKDVPFFMYLAFNAPHDPRQAPKRWVDKYPVEQIELPKSYLDDYPYKDAMGCGKDLRDETLAPFPRTPYAVKKHIQEYYASISYMDEQIGRILAALQQSGKLENTYIFFTADHGLAIGNHGLMGKQNMFEHSLRPPLIVSGPAILKQAKRHQAVYLQDVMATSLALAGVEKPSRVFYNSLLPLLKNTNAPGNYPSIYGCYMDLQRMVSSEGYKLILYPSAGKMLLFNLKDDPEEMHDIAPLASSRPMMKKLKARLIQQQQQMNDKLDLTAILSGI